MKLIAVTDEVFKLIDKIQSDEGFNEKMEEVCAGFSSATRHLQAAEDYCDEGIMPLVVLAEYKELLEQLAKSREADEAVNN
jgi:hypothetical protein